MEAYAPEIAIVNANTLSSLGLEGLLQEIIPSATIRVFNSFAELTDDTPDMYAHYFVSMPVFFDHPAFFLRHKYRTVVLVGGDNLPQLSGVLTLNVNQDQPNLVKSLIRLHRHGHQAGCPGKPHPVEESRFAGDGLTPREAEVLVMLVKGLINKEIAQKLHISLTTVITHRKNITEKLGIKSVSGLTIYAVTHGYVEADAV